MISLKKTNGFFAAVCLLFLHFPFSSPVSISISFYRVSLDHPAFHDSNSFRMRVSFDSFYVSLIRLRSSSLTPFLSFNAFDTVTTLDPTASAICSRRTFFLRPTFFPTFCHLSISSSMTLLTSKITLT